MTALHSIECQLHQGRIASEQFAYDRRWPSWCRTCRREGSVIKPIESDGVAWFWCPDCLGAGLCPRCAAALVTIATEFGVGDIDRDVIVCEACGWDEDDSWEDRPELLCGHPCDIVCAFSDDGRRKWATIMDRTADRLREKGCRVTF